MALIMSAVRAYWMLGPFYVAYIIMRAQGKPKKHNTGHQDDSHHT
jgi:hypothetical protein